MRFLVISSAKNYNITVYIKNCFIRWTRPPEEGERTDNEDQEEEGEGGRQGEERRQAESSHRESWEKTDILK